jgi:hypothetical protein
MPTIRSRLKSIAVITVAMGATVAICPTPAAAKLTGEAQVISSGRTSRMVPMSEPLFWGIVDRSRSDDPDTQIGLLRQQLMALSPDEIVAWEIAFDQHMRRSYRWDLWGAAFVAMGGASDDSFEYFRLWLLSRGKGTFEKVLSDPDSLVEFAPANPEQLEFEDFAHVGPDVWSTKTGKSWDEMPNIPSFFDPSGYGSPSGEEFSEDSHDLAVKYPRLWRKFGDAR